MTGIQGPIGRKTLYCLFLWRCRFGPRHSCRRGRHGEAVEVAFNGDLFQCRAVVVYQIEVKRGTALRQVQGRPFDYAQDRLFCLCRLRPARRKDDPVTVGMEIGREVGGAVFCHLSFARPVGVHDEQFQIPRFHQIPAQQFPVDLTFLRCFGVLRPVHDPLAVRRVERPARSRRRR